MLFKYSLTERVKTFKVICWGILEIDKKIVLIQEGKRDYFYGKWGFPIAGVRVNENMTEAVVRGVREDINLRTEVESLVGVYNWYHQELGIGYIYYAFALKYLGGKLKPNHKEILNVGLFSYQEIFKMHSDSLTHKDFKSVIKRYRRHITYPLDVLQEI